MELDKDLLARQEARDLAKSAASAQRTLADLPQEKLDAIVEAVAKATGLGTDRITVLKME